MGPVEQAKQGSGLSRRQVLQGAAIGAAWSAPMVWTLSPSPAYGGTPAPEADLEPTGTPAPVADERVGEVAEAPSTGTPTDEETPDELAFTGLNLGVLAAVGAGTLVAGGATLHRARRELRVSSAAAAHEARPLRHEGNGA